MQKNTANKLIKLGWDEKYLKFVQENFKPNKTGKFQMVITDIEDLAQDPRTGTFVDTVFFDTEFELSIIHYFYEGLAYVLTVSETGEWLGEGVIDGAPFDEVSEFTHKEWGWHPDTEIENNLNLVKTRKSLSF